MGRMSLLTPLLSAYPASPRLTVYDEVAGTRMEFSAMTLDNWANKIANMLIDEFDLDPHDPFGESPTIIVDLPVSWQAAVIPVGIYNAGLSPYVDVNREKHQSSAGPRLVFTTVERAKDWDGVPDVVVVSNDPFGRGVVESGGTLPPGLVDFGPTVRFYGDQFYDNPYDLNSWVLPEDGPERYLVPGWTTGPEFERRIMCPLAAGGSVVVIAGVASAERVEQIMEAEKVTETLS